MSSISLHVNFKERDFTIVKNSIIRDTSIKPASRILLIFLLGCDPERFSINTGSLAKSIGVGRSAITSASKELQDANYLVIEKFSNGHVSWNVFECPIECENIKNENPDTEKPYTENPDMENQHALRRTNLKEELINKNTVQQVEHARPAKSKEFEQTAFGKIWEIWPVKQGKKKASESFAKLTAKLKTDDEIKELTVRILNYQHMALQRLKATNGDEYIGSDRIHLATFLNQRRYEDLTAEEVLQILSEA